MEQNADFYGNTSIGKILLKIAPPVMLAQLIQALYNIVDSFFVGKVSQSGLTALSIVYPLQLLIIAFAVGTGVGINTDMSFYLGMKKKDKAKESAGIGTPLIIIVYIIFAIFSYFFMPYYAKLQTKSEEIIKDVIIYGRTVCVFSFGAFLESVWSKILQAYGDMKTPMIAQIIGALVNIVLDAILIFGFGSFKGLGIFGAALATVIGQVITALIVMFKAFTKPPKFEKKITYLTRVKKIYALGIPNILMQSAYTFYIFGLNLILSRFSDQAVTVLGLYYKVQSFFFIPLGALQTCIVPVISYNYARKSMKRCKKTLYYSLIIGIGLMFIGLLCFELIPKQLLSIFTDDQEVLRIGVIAFRIIGISFIPIVTSLIYPVFFQAVGEGIKSSLLTIIRTVVLFVPLGYLFSLISLEAFWLTYPITETITTIIGFILYYIFMHNYYKNNKIEADSN